jgi:predicted metal-dependent enzyme (double-stranded beta helix superfamily)
MKQMNHKIILASILAGGLFVGIVKGQEARSRWVTKMKTRREDRKMKLEKNPGEVTLDDFEIASFHKN